MPCRPGSGKFGNSRLTHSQSRYNRISYTIMPGPDVSIGSWDIEGCARHGWPEEEPRGTHHHRHRWCASRRSTIRYCRISDATSLKIAGNPVNGCRSHCSASSSAFRAPRCGAIRRTGRIDQNYLLLPPDAASRQRILTGFLRDAIKSGDLQRDSALDPVCIDWNGRWEGLQNSSFFLGYTDMKSAVDRVVHRDSTTEIEDLERELRGWGRTTTLRLYNRAFDETEDHDAIKSEFLPLVAMATREVKEFADKPWLDNGPLFKQGETDDEIPFASKCDLKNKALDFVRNCSWEYDPK